MSAAVIGDMRVESGRLGPATVLIDAILRTHHEFARETLARLVGATALLQAERGAADAGSAAIAEAVAMLNDEMLMHMRREEQVLFPTIVDLEATGDVTEADVGMLLSPIVCMKREHGSIDELLVRLAGLTDQFRPAANASATQRELLRLLAEFATDTAEHVRKENDELFPLAMELAPPVR